MALHLDLEEQEQVDQLKHFWKQYGNLISWLLILVFSSFAAVNGWNYWQSNQSAKASVMFDEVEKAIMSRDAAKIDRAYKDMKDHFGRTTLAQQAGLISARALYELDQRDQAQAALQWVADEASDEGYQAIARLRLTALLIDKKAYDEALKQLTTVTSVHFVGLVADRKGDVLMAQGQTANAKAEYEKAWKILEEDNDYRKLVEAKLNALGVDVNAIKVPVSVAHNATPGAQSEGKK